MWLEYLLLRDGSVELLCSPTLMKKEASKDAFFIQDKKDCSKRDGRGGKYVEETVIRLYNTVTVP